MSTSRHSIIAYKWVCALLVTVSWSAFGQSLGPAPAWVTSIPVGTWAKISTNMIASVDPAKDAAANPNYPNGAPWTGGTGLTAVTDAWNGGVLATGFGTKGSLVVWGGGHGDYFGNEVYAFDLAQRQWSRLTNPYKTPSFPITDGIWPDGTPSVPHTFSQLVYDPPTNSLVCFRTMEDAGLPVYRPVPVMFSFATKTWRRGPKNSSDPTTSGGWATYDASRNIYWLEGGNGSGVFSSYKFNGDGTNGVWTNYTLKNGGLLNRGTRDPINDILVITAFRDGPSVYALDLKNPSGTTVQLTQAGSPPTREAAEGWEWSDIRKGFLYWRRGAGVYEFKLSSGSWSTGVWTWTNLTTGSNSVVPEDMHQDNGVLSRFQLARFDDAEIAVVVNRVDGDVFAFRIPGPGTLIRPKSPTSTGAN